MAQPVYNEQTQKVGIIDDLIVAPDTTVSFVIIGAGGFVGVGRHDVAIPVNQLKQQDDGKFILAGATKEAIKALPKFEYAKKKRFGLGCTPERSRGNVVDLTSRAGDSPTRARNERRPRGPR